MKVATIIYRVCNAGLGTWLMEQLTEAENEWLTLEVYERCVLVNLVLWHFVAG